MIKVQKTDIYARWLNDLRDLRARARIQVRVERLIAGNPGNVRPVGQGVSELKIDHGPGYRVYYTRKRNTWIMLLCGGDKSTQKTDIAMALKLAKNL